MNHLLRKNFSRFLLINDFPVISEDKGLIITPNHFSWWDGFFIHYLMTKFSKRKAYLMMLEEQLVKYPFFKYLGVFSVNPASLSSVKQSLAFAEKISSIRLIILYFIPKEIFSRINVKK
ncbi:MAG: 1-acyl-sn-glycerol-3-phosphate acyltransferase [Ignavibacteria bacterium]|nr:1-acyl-sn-glycerol-3-phosphate acyltransferase [Ignavibacteria bacterium]